MAGIEAQPRLHIVEGGFNPRPERLAEFAARHEQLMPYVMAQPGFRESYGGPIPGGPWMMFVAKFDTLEQMERWQRNRTHVEVQDVARDKWFAAYYLRKARLLSAGEAASGKILCETAILRGTQFTPAERDRVQAALAQLLGLPLVPYETLGGERIETPYAFSGAVEIEPRSAPVQYVLLTNWRNMADCAHWQRSDAYHELERLGEVRSALFEVIPERRPRLGLRADRMQREWVAEE